MALLSKTASILAAVIGVGLAQVIVVAHFLPTMLS